MCRPIYCRCCQKVTYLMSFLLDWRSPRLLEGEGAMARLPAVLEEYGCRSVAIVTDKGIRSLGLIDPLTAALEKSSILYIIYDEVEPNPTIDCVERGLAAALEAKCDGIIAIGGGSPIDCAKLIAARMACPRKPVRKMAGVLKIGKKLPPLIAVPTTSGTGSETTLAAVVTDPSEHHKYAVSDPHLIPVCAVLDPTLTAGLPRSLTASTGMDTLCHAVEAYIGHSNTRQTKADALETVRLVFSSLPRAVENGRELEARADMQRAAFLGGRAFTRAYVGCVHAAAHTLGGYYNIPHGLANAVLLPVVLRRYGKSAHKRLAELAAAAGLPCEKGTSRAQLAEEFIAAIEKMNADFGFPKGFEQIKAEDIPTLARFADKEANPLYPTPRMLTRKDFEDILESVRI